MKTLDEWPATLIPPTREEQADRERSRAALQGREEPRAHVEPLDANWLPIGDVVVLLLRRL